MKFLRLLIIISIFFQFCSGSALAALRHDAIPGDSAHGGAALFDTVVEVNLPLTGVSRFLMSSFPLAPALAMPPDESTPVNGALPVVCVRGFSDCSSRMVAKDDRSHEHLPRMQMGVADIAPSSLCPPGEGYAAALRMYLVVITAAVFPSLTGAGLRMQYYQYPAPRVGFFIAEGTRV